MDNVRSQFETDLAAVTTPADLEAVRVRYLGKKGVITELRKSVDFKSMSDDEKRDFGQAFGSLRDHAESRIAVLRERLAASSVARASIDLSLPGSDRRVGHLHPVTLVQLELEAIFQAMGFMVLDWFHVELERYNFDALNIPADHPAREMQDTYWLTNGLVLRTHTSSNQVRALETYGAPLRAIFPGRCFRNENEDASHANTFYQCEGLYIDREVSIAQLIAVMKALLSEVFHRDVKVRLRPGFFPFVEPGFELDMACLLCGGDGCAVCKRSGWVEMLPCGLVHPRVLAAGGIDASRWSGFAFGLGLTRLAMMKYSIPDIRLMNAADVRFAEQFPAAV